MPCPSSHSKLEKGMDIPWSLSLGVQRPSQPPRPGGWWHGLAPRLPAGPAEPRSYCFLYLRSVHSLLIILYVSPLCLKYNHIPPPPPNLLHTPIACHASAAIPRRYPVYSHPRAFAFAVPSTWNSFSVLLHGGLPVIQLSALMFPLQRGLL